MGDTTTSGATNLDTARLDMGRRLRDFPVLSGRASSAETPVASMSANVFSIEESESSHPFSGANAVAELSQYLAPFASCFKRSEGRLSLERHVAGLLFGIGRKNSEQIARTVAGTNSQRLQALLTELQWDVVAANEIRVQQLIREATLRGGTLVCGEIQMPKQGNSSVGVCRQYVEDLKRAKNCQILLSWQYVDAAFSWPVNAQVYLPQEWTSDLERCRKARIPEEMRHFRTKPEIVLSLLDEADRLKVPYRGIATAASYGSDPTFLAELERRKIDYVVAVPDSFTVQVARRRSPAAEAAQEAIARLADNAWQVISWPRGLGAGGRSLWARVMGWRATSAGHETFGWLVAERPFGGARGPIRYYFSNAGPQVSLSTIVRLAKRTTRIDDFYRFAKDELGWNHYEGRLWHGLHRHALLVFLAYSFLQLLRIRHYCAAGSIGLFSPSTGD